MTGQTERQTGSMRNSHTERLYERETNLAVISRSKHDLLGGMVYRQLVRQTGSMRNSQTERDTKIS